MEKENNDELVNKKDTNKDTITDTITDTNKDTITDNINNEIFYIIQKLGEGAFGKVYLVKRDKDNLLYAAKILKEDNRVRENANIDNEFEINKKVKELKNPNIVNLVCYGEGKIKRNNEITLNKKYYIFEYALKGNLYNYAKNIPIFGEIQVSKAFFEKILKAVQAMHLIGIYHLDLKLDNILLDDNYEPKITDFGLAKTFEESNNGILNGYIGTNGYMSPQIELNMPFNGIKSDIFSLGVTLFHLLFGVMPFSKAKDKDIYYNYIIKNKKDDFWKSLKKKYNFKLSKEFKNLFLKMVAYKEEKRPNIKEILEDDWFKEIRNLNNEGKKDLEAITLAVFHNKEYLLNKIFKQNNPSYSNYKEEKEKLREEIKKGKETMQKQYFDNKIKIKIMNKDINMTDYIRIQENINIIEFMNEFANYCYDLGDDIIVGTKNLKFYVIFNQTENDSDDDENDDDKNEAIIKNLTIQIKIYKHKDIGYSIRFMKKTGVISDYYRKLKIIIEKAKEIIYLSYIK